MALKLLKKLNEKYVMYPQISKNSFRVKKYLRVINAIILTILVFLLVTLVVGSVKESASLGYIVTLKQERDALYQDFGKPTNGASDYLAACKLFQEAPNLEVRQKIFQIVSDGWKNPSPDVIAWIEANASALERIRLGNAKPMHLMPRIERFNAPRPTSVVTIRDMTDILIATGKRAEALGDMERAVDAYMDAIRFGYGVGTDRSFISVMLSDGMCKLGFTALREVTPQVVKTDKLADVVRELALLERNSVSLAESFKTELLITAPGIWYSYGRRRSWNLHWLWYRHLLMPYVGGQYIRLIAHSQLSYPDAVKSTWWLQRYHQSSNVLLMLDNPIGKHWAAYVLGGLLRGEEVHALTQTDARATQLVIALQLFKLQHGRFPRDLTELQSGTDVRLPVDPFSEQPFRYKSEEHGYVLYSVGPDLTDNMGRIAYVKDHHPIGSDLLYSFTPSGT